MESDRQINERTYTVAESQSAGYLEFNDDNDISGTVTYDDSSDDGGSFTFSNRE